MFTLDKEAICGVLETLRGRIPLELHAELSYAVQSMSPWQWANFAATRAWQVDRAATDAPVVRSNAGSEPTSLTSYFTSSGVIDAQKDVPMNEVLLLESKNLDDKVRELSAGAPSDDDVRAVYARCVRLMAQTLKDHNPHLSEKNIDALARDAAKGKMLGDNASAAWRQRVFALEA